MVGVEGRKKGREGEGEREDKTGMEGRREGGKEGRREVGREGGRKEGGN